MNDDQRQEDLHNCYLCGSNCDEDDKCAGCEHFICCNCDVNTEVPWGTHAPDDHQEPED